MKIKQAHAGAARIAGAEEKLCVQAPGESAESLYAGSATLLRIPPDVSFECEHPEP
ncbi:MAG: hypothetical protein K2W96_12970 [Gemmataceae bacterium]|nr:hypothetical protein [Gemmataceae bacterium]